MMHRNFAKKNGWNDIEFGMSEFKLSLYFTNPNFE